MKTHPKIWTPSLGLLALGLVACGDSEEAIVQPSATTPVTYGEVSSVIATRCGPCHIGGGTEPEMGGNAFRSCNMTQVLETIETGAMPPGGPRLGPTEQQLIRNWVEQGAQP